MALFAFYIHAMTVIAFDGRIIAADKRANYGSLQRTTTKLHRVTPIHGDYKGHELIVGTAGISAQGKEMIEWIRRGMDPQDFPSTQRDSKESCACMVVHRDGTKWSFERAPYPLVLEDQKVAIGSGRDFALAAMFMGADARQAVEVACHFDTSCGNGIDWMSI